MADIQESGAVDIKSFATVKVGETTVVNFGKPPAPVVEAQTKPAKKAAE